MYNKILCPKSMSKEDSARYYVRVFIYSESVIVHCAVARIVAPEGDELLCRIRLPLVLGGAVLDAYFDNFLVLLGRGLR